jgi:hypothetical protein
VRGASWRLFVLCMGCLLLQACTPPPKRLLDETARQSSGDRESLVVVEQGELRAAIKVSNVSSGMGGSGGAVGALIGAIIDTSVNQHRADAAEDGVKPLRNALIDYDFDRRALQAMQLTLAKIPGFDATKVAFGKDGSHDKLLSVLDHSGSSQVLVARYGYTLSPDFSQLVVDLAVDIYPKNVTQGSSQTDRVSASSALYTQRFWYVESVPQKLRVLGQNVTQWSDNGARAARAALDVGLSGVDDLFIRSMSQTPEAAAALDKGRNIELVDQRGSLVETSDKGTLLYNGKTGTWIFVDGIQTPAQ